MPKRKFDNITASRYGAGAAGAVISNNARAGASTAAGGHEDGEDELGSALPSDTLAALQLLRSEFRCIITARRRPSALAPAVPVFEQVAPVPVALRSQLYAVMGGGQGAASQADDELDALAAARTVRLCKLSGGVDEFAIVFVDDLQDYVRVAAVRYAAQRNCHRILTHSNQGLICLVPGCPWCRTNGVCVGMSLLVPSTAQAGRPGSHHEARPLPPPHLPPHPPRAGYPKASRRHLAACVASGRATGSCSRCFGGYR
jgi:hypothetical protein